MNNFTTYKKFLDDKSIKYDTFAEAETMLCFRTSLDFIGNINVFINLQDDDSVEIALDIAKGSSQTRRKLLDFLNRTPRKLCSFLVTESNSIRIMGSSILPNRNPDLLIDIVHHSLLLYLLDIAEEMHPKLMKIIYN